MFVHATGGGGTAIRSIAIGIVLSTFAVALEAGVPTASIAASTADPHLAVALRSAGMPRMPYSRQPDSSKSAQEKVLYSFTGGADGDGPGAGLIDVSGVLYGTTFSGGTYGAGTVFGVSAGGIESVLYSFTGLSDGNEPGAGLIDVNGVLYSTTPLGGKYDSGTVFEVTAGGTENVLYNFPRSGKPGNSPRSDLVYANGILYGTTFFGGKNLVGTVFEMTTGGTETVLHTFNGTDGKFPYAGLVYANGVLYGTTSSGGQYNDGTVFEVTANGTYRVLHSFNGTDGEDPSADLLYANGVLYGTTFEGGSGDCSGPGYDGCGTVFELGSSGKEKVLYSFTGGADGGYPVSSLISVNGMLYGTTSAGGKYNDGTVFRLTAGGIEGVLHSFKGSATDGQGPYAGLVYANGVFYGTTAYGGKYNDGTVFEVTPAP